MSSIRRWYKNRNRNRRAQELIVPLALTNIEELKTSKRYGDREKQLWRMLGYRASRSISYERTVKVKNGDGIKGEKKIEEPSMGDEVMRQMFIETGGLGGALGDESPLDLDCWEAVSRFRDALECAQQKYGAGDPYVQSLARWARTAADRVLPRTITSDQVHTDRVLLSMEGGLSSPINVEVGKTGEMGSNRIEDYIEAQVQARLNQKSKGKESRKVA